MTVFDQQSKRNQALAFGGILLWVLVATMLISGAVTTAMPRSLQTAFFPKTANADIGSTTCGTYTNPANCGGDDCGINIPVVDQGQVDTDCDGVTGINVCQNGVYPDCICQQGSGGNCGSVGGPPTPPQVSLTDMGAQWEGVFRWWTGVAKSDNCTHYSLQSPGNPQPWRCIWGTGEPGCAGNLNTYCDGTSANEHVIIKSNLPENSDYYFGVKSGSPAPELKSEVRRFQTYVEDFSITVTPPANTKIVTGEQTNLYTVTVTPIGGATGTVTLSVADQSTWVPPILGTNVIWPSGNTVDLSSPQPKTFRITTDDGSPPTWPPVTLAEIYDFRVIGTHPSLPQRSADVFDGLTVMDYRMIPSVGSIDMDPNGDSDSFDVTFDWLPPGWQYDRTVNLTNNAIPGLSVTLSQTSVTNSTGSIHVDLTTSGAASGPHTLTITGTGNPGGLLRQAQVIINIGAAPDFSLSIATPSQNVNQGGTVNNTATVTSFNGFSEPVVLSGFAIMQGQSNPEPSITLSFNPPQPQPPANNAVNSTVQLTTTGTTPCLPGAGQRYTVTIEGRDNVQVGPPDAMRNVSYDLFVICAVAPGFTMVAVPNPQSVFQGDAATYQVTVTSQNGFNDTVNLNLNSPCAGAGSVCTYPSSVVVTPSAPGVFNFVVDTDISTPTGGYQMELDGDAQSGPETGLVMIILNVEAGPDYTFTVTPDPLNITVGSSGAYTVTITPSGGFDTPVRITWTMNPANPNVGFSPSSGNLIINPGNNAPITVTANPGSVGNYLLNFTATPQGPGPTKHIDGVQLNILNAICNGDCPNICANQANQPHVPEIQCMQDTDCPQSYHCASQTCRGVAGCTIDPPPGPYDCNKDICYDDSGAFIIPPPAPDCYQSWPRCKQYDILKVKKDRQCDRWLSCEEAVIYDDPVSKKEVTQCLNLGVCTQLAPNGECANWVPEPGTKENLTYLSPLEVMGTTSLIRNYSGYSSGFHFTGETKRVCQRDKQTTCDEDADCGPNGPCLSAQTIIESTYASQAIEETGLDGGTLTDLVRNGTFEELRCIGGARDGLSCIVTSDCRVGRGTCVNVSPARYSRVPCDKNVDCADAEDRNGGATPICKYLITASMEDKDTVDCPNPRMSVWLGVKRPGNGFEASYDDPGGVMGIKNNAAGQPAVRVMIREDEENLEIVNEDARHSLRGNNVAEKHKKDGNNFLRATVLKDAALYSGVGVPIDQSIVERGLGYVLSFKFRYESEANPQEPIKAQLAFNYEKVVGGYENSDFEAFDFEITQDSGEVEIPGTTEWQTFVLGPVVPSDFTVNKTAFLNFITNADHNYDDPTVFFIDDVTLKPSLDVAYSHLTASDTKKIERRCRLYPKNESAECHYFDENGTEYKGWRGYCLDKDPQNPDLCLTWWPLDLLAGESPFTAASKTGYDDRSPLYYCLQNEGGNRYANDKKSGGIGNNDEHKEFFDLSGWNIRWRDIERVVILSDVNDDQFERNIESTYHADASRANGSEFKMTVYPNWQAGNGQWGFGAFCLKETADCQSSWNNGWDWVWEEDCDSGSDKLYVAAGVKINEPNSPDSPTATLGHIGVKYCHDDGGDFDEDIETRVLVYTRATCNAVAQVVKSPSEENENKAWTKRTDQISNYVVPDLSYGYMSDKAPFGAMVTQAIPPDQWGGPNGWSNDPQQLDAMTSAEPTAAGNDRAGTAFSCRRNCGNTDASSKYCYAPNLPANGCDGTNCENGTANRCATRNQIDDCLSHGAGSVCVGRPLGHCTGNLLLACAADGDCAAANAGTCTSDTVGSNQTTYEYARDHLKRLFAKSYGCWELQSVGPFLEDGRQVWHTKYVNGCTQPGGTWDIITDPDGGYCAGGTRLAYPNDYCALRPDIDENTFIIDDVRDGNFTVNVGETIRGGFSYQVDAEQKPLKNGTIVWEWDGNKDADCAATETGAECECRKAGFSGLPETGKVNMTHRYLGAGSYRAIACVKDNWGAIGYYEFPGIITAQ